MAGLSQDEARTIAEEAASKVLLQFFSYFDIDASNTASLKSFREDLEYLRSQRQGTERLTSALRKSALTIVGSTVIGALYLIWTIFKDGLMQFIDKH